MRLGRSAARLRSSVRAVAMKSWRRRATTVSSTIWMSPSAWSSTSLIPRQCALAVDAAGELDAVVNNAAVCRARVRSRISRWTGCNRSSTRTPTVRCRVVQQLIPAWRARGAGVIVNVSSVQGRVSTPLEGAYAASKYALEALSETLHYELAHFGIRVVIIQPGYIAPGMKASPRHDGPADYAALWDQWTGTDAKMTGPAGRPGPELVGVAIADAIENPETPLRVPVGADAEMVLGARQHFDDAAFEAAMRKTLDLQW